jgi:dipeptidyl aminopeptidase/acylaminoacyl peptidase
MRRMVLLIAAVLVATAGIAVRSGRKARELVTPVRSTIPPQRTVQARRELPGLESISLRTADGLVLRGWYAPGSNRGAVILVHGGGGNRLQLYPEARMLARHGYGVLLYDSRAEGESEGQLISWGDREQRDVAAALDFLSARPEVDPARIALLGFSIGGSTVALAAARDQRARAVILYATWTSMEDELHRARGKYGLLSWWPALFVARRAGVDLGNVRPIDHIREISPRPLLMITGTADDDTPVPVMQRLFAAAGEPKELHIIPGAEHGTYLQVAPARVEALMTGFLARALPASPR